MSDCHITGCKNLHTTCISCGRLICEKILSTTMQWIRVEDSLPEKGKVVLIISNGEIFQACCSYISSNPDWHDIKNKGIIEDVTHWMPLPKPPQEEIK